MKEKLFKKGIKRRLFSVVLALAMVISLLPMNSMKVYAADEPILADTITGTPGAASGKIFSGEVYRLKAEWTTAEGCWSLSGTKQERIYIYRGDAQKISKVVFHLAQTRTAPSFYASSGTVTFSGDDIIVSDIDTNDTFVFYSNSEYYIDFASSVDIYVNPHTCSASEVTESNKKAEQAATCTADGWSAYWICSCGKVYAPEDFSKSYDNENAWKTGDGKKAALGHDWEYTADGATITASCNRKATCGQADVSLTLTTTSPNYSGSAYDGLSFGDGEKDTWDAEVGAPTIKYVGSGNTTYTESEIAPTKPGTYIVKVYPASEDANPVHVITKDFEITRVTPAPGVDKIIDIDDINWTYKFYKNGRYKRTGDDEKGTITNVKFYNISGTTIAINLGYGISGSFGNITNAEYSELLSIDKIKEFIGDTSNYVGVQVNYYESSHSLQFSIILHDHNWNYSADGNKIEAYCANDDCLSGTSETDKIALTLNAESQTVSQKEAYTGASLENLEAFMGATELDEEPIIKYYKVDAKGATTGGSEVEAAKVRATVGNYYASVTVGDVTAVKAFEIKNDTATSYDTIVTKEFDTGKSKKGITIGKAGDESSANLNGIITINAKIKVTMLDEEWTPTGYVLSRVTPDNLAATKWISVSGNKVEQKNLKKLAAVKYNAKKKQTLIGLKQNKKVEGAVYAIRLEDGKGNTIYMNIECIELAKDIKKSALSVSANETVPTADAMLAMADGDTAKTIALTMLGSKTQSEFNSNAVTWVIGSGKNASTLKKGEVKPAADKSGKAIAYLTVADDGTVKVVSGSVKGKVKLTGVVNRKAYKTTVTVK